MRWIIVTPAFVTLLMLCFRSQAWVFRNVYLTVLLMLPMTYRLYIGGFPEMTFAYTAIIPLAVIFVVTHIFKWKWTLLDLLVILYTVWGGISEGASASYGMYGFSAWNLTLNGLSTTMFTVMLPYMLAKGLIEPAHQRYAFAKRFVFLLFLDLLLMSSELFLHKNFWTSTIGRFFAGEWHGYPMYRLGMWRIYGPFDHPILAGLVFVVGYRLCRWIEWNDRWEPKFVYCRWLPWPKAAILRFSLALAIVLTSSRGPWLGALAGALFIGVARAKHKIPILVVRAVLGGLLFTIIYLGLSVWFAQDTASSVYYRWHLLDVYWELASTNPWFGLGQTGWTPPGSHTSVDNFYLYLAILRGVPGLVLFAAIMVAITWRLMGRAFSYHTEKPLLHVLAFTMISLMIAFAVTLTTVWIEDQMHQVLFILIGWAEGYMLRQREKASLDTVTPQRRLAPTRPSAQPVLVRR